MGLGGEGGKELIAGAKPGRGKPKRVQRHQTDIGNHVYYVGGGERNGQRKRKKRGEEQNILGEPKYDCVGMQKKEGGKKRKDRAEREVLVGRKGLKRERRKKKDPVWRHRSWGKWQVLKKGKKEGKKAVPGGGGINNLGAEVKRADGIRPREKKKGGGGTSNE